MSWYLQPFQDLTLDTLYDIMKVRMDVFVVEQQCPYPDLDDHDQHALHYYLKQDGKIAAYVRLLPGGTRYAYASIGRVLVAEPYRQNGYAREIMTKAMHYITETWQEDTVKIQAQQYLQTFYESLGFEQISDAYPEDGIVHIDMVWQKK